MTTTIHVTRATPFTKSDALREDADLYTEAQTLGAWLAERDIETVTMNEVLVFEQVEHEDAVLDEQPVEYAWIWDPVEQRWYVECKARGRISFHLPGQSDAVVIEIAISATY